MAADAGLKGLYLVGVGKARSEWNPVDFGFDASVNPQLPSVRPTWISWRSPFEKVKNWHARKKGFPTIYSYESTIPSLLHHPKDGVQDHPCVIPNWDNTPRSSGRGLVLHESTPELFRLHLREAISMARKSPEGRQFLFVKSWNEWAEGNHLEPDLRYGHEYLQVFLDELKRG